jgi:hypothetical protein
MGAVTWVYAVALTKRYKHKNIGGGVNMYLWDLLEEKITKVGLYLNQETRDLKSTLLIFDTEK